MSPILSATYRIKLQTPSILNLAFKKAGAKRSSPMTKARPLHQQTPIQDPRRREPILWAWC